MKQLIWLAMLCAVVPVSASAQGREVPVSPLIIQTLEPRLGAEPAVVRTNEPFTVTYRVVFYDLASRGKEISVLEDDLKPANISASEFTVRDRSIRKYRVGGLLVWDFTYTFTIVNATKSSMRKQYYIPPINFKWVIRDLGTGEGAQVREWPTDSVIVHYVPSVAPMPYVDVRHVGDLGSYSLDSFLLVWGARLTILFSLAAVVLLVLRAVRLQRAFALADLEAEASAFGLGGAKPIGPDFVEVSRGRMRRRLARLCRDAAKTTPVDASAMLELQRNLQVTLWKLLLASLPELSRANTPSDVLLYAQSLPSTRYVAALVALAEKCQTYYQATLRRAVCSGLESRTDAQELMRLNRELRWDRMLLSRIKASLARLSGRLSSGVRRGRRKP